MSFTAMLKPKYATILAVTGIASEDEEGDEALRSEEREEQQAKIALLNHLLLERYGMDMGGRLGINSSRGKLAEIYIRSDKGKTPEEKAKNAVKKVDGIIASFMKTLDTLRFPQATAGHGR